MKIFIEDRSKERSICSKTRVLTFRSIDRSIRESYRKYDIFKYVLFKGMLRKKKKKKGNSWKRRDPIFSPLGHARVEGVAIAKKRKKKKEKTADFAPLADRHIGVKLGTGQREKRGKCRKRSIVGRERSERRVKRKRIKFSFKKYNNSRRILGPVFGMHTVVRYPFSPPPPCHG